MAHCNESYLNLQGSYLFAAVREKADKYKQVHPQAQIISLGIGDVTQPLAQAVITAMHKAVDEMGNMDTFRGYGPEQGYLFLRQAIAEHDFQARGVQIDPSEIFVSDGAKCDVGNIQEIFLLLTLWQLRIRFIPYMLTVMSWQEEADDLYTILMKELNIFPVMKNAVLKRDFHPMIRSSFIFVRPIILRGQRLVNRI